MTPAGPTSDSEDLRRRTLAFMRTSAPFAFCDACLALRLGFSLAEMAAVLTGLLDEADTILARRRRVCYGCGRTVELSAMRDGPG